MYGWGGGILHGRDLLKDYVGKAIGNGQTTRLWKDSWISLSEDTKQYGPIKEEHLDLRVSDLLTSELKWNRQRIEKLIPELASQIQCIQPSRSGAEDIFIWQPLPSGVYSTKSGDPTSNPPLDLLAWDKSRNKAGIAWIFKGTLDSGPKHGSTVTDCVNSPLVAEALAVRASLYEAATLEFQNLRVYLDNSTLIGAINNKTRRKEILGIINDIQRISSVFVSIVFFHISRKNTPKQTLWQRVPLRTLLCNGPRVLDLPLLGFIFF
ncbi:BnaC03g16720D [Brassica napus]|uniref:BnaC03g16720D protein n=3 Tax=Brassica TaxID=3705 RepID=A0A078GFC3_BRANA|nr:BnaC03g16720D [Brassica napus]VDC88484.1 unnamed protein product [Brassica oleracea]